MIRPTRNGSIAIGSCDGDMMEGVASEAASLAGHLQLGKLICLYDANRTSLAGPTSVSFTEDVGARFAAYGWHVEHVDEALANDVDTLDAAIGRAKAATERPSIILVHSVIGFGSPKAGTFAAHGEPLGPENVRKTKEALGWPTEPAFLEPVDAMEYFAERKVAGAKAHAAWNIVFADWKRAMADIQCRKRQCRIP
jgi:transketolase